MAIATQSPLLTENIPALLKNLNQWVCWKYSEREGKRTKVPYSARSGKMAQSNNPKTWVSFEGALDAFETGQYDGIGFVLTAENGIIGGDLDHCISEDEVLHDWAEKIIATVDSYTEITPSGAGLRFFIKGTLPAGGRKSGDIEMYNNGRFLTITGNHWPDTPLEINAMRQDEFDALYLEHFPEIEPVAEKPHTNGNGHSKGHSAPAGDDAARIALMLNSKNGGEIRELWDGGLGGHKSASEADSALCFHLAFWLDRDIARVDQAFRQSSRYREKWDVAHHASGETYGQRTVRVACEKVGEGYKPPRKMLTPNRVLRGKQARAFIDGMSEEAAAEVNPDGDETDPEDWRTGAYGISDGRLVHIFEKTLKGEITTVVSTIANLTAYVAREVTTEHGERFFVIKGQNVLGRKFEFEISADVYSDEKRLKAAFIAAAGAKSTVMASMAKHLYPAVDVLTGHIEQSTRYDRVGWAKTPNGDIFLMPGREDKLPEYSSIHLQGQMPYELREGADLEKGLKALRHLLRAQSTPLLCVELAAIIQAPLSYVAGWRNERYATFITGRTNSFKTETTKLMCSLYGPDFVDDRNLIRWDGTVNGIVKMATLAYDMPLFIDNYKPNVGKDAAAKCISLIQSIVEGSEKTRMNRDRTLADRDAIYAHPFITGEDVPDSDAASLARILVLRLPQVDAINNELTKAQALSHHLCTVGGVLFDWLESKEGHEIAHSIGRQYLDQRGEWSNYLRSIRRDMQGVPRIATNLATNQLTWAIMLHCPALRSIAEEFAQEHEAGLRIVARDMSNQTAESLEAHRYLEAIRQLVAVQKYTLVPRAYDIPQEQQDRVIGWFDDEGTYLMPDLAYKAAVDLLRDAGGLNGLTKNTLHKQMDSLGLLANKGSGGATINKRCSGNVQRVLHLAKEALELKTDDIDDDDGVADL